MSGCRCGAFCLIQHPKERTRLAEAVGFWRRAFEEIRDLSRRKHAQHLRPFLPSRSQLPPIRSPTLEITLCEFDHVGPAANEQGEPPIALAVLDINLCVRIRHYHAPN